MLKLHDFVHWFLENASEMIYDIMIKHFFKTLQPVMESGALERGWKFMVTW